MRTRLFRFLTVVLTFTSLLNQPPCSWADAAEKRVAPHPLDPLTKDEIAATTAVLKDAGKVADSTRFVLMYLREPPKEKVLAYRPEQTLPRQAFAVLYDWDSNTTSEAVVDLTEKKLVSWKNVPRRQPPVFPDEDHEKTADIVRADPRWREAMEKRGIMDLDDIGIHGWPLGAYGEDRDGHRRTLAVMFAREYGPIDDLLVHVDLTAKKIIKLEDKGVREWRRKLSDFAPLDERDEGEGPEGPSSQPPPKNARFQVQGNAVSWGRWRFRFSLHPRVGLVLHTVGYQDEDKVRPILYRANLSEMAVPYGDPNWTFWCPFDAGEYGMGVYAKTSLNYGLDAPKDAAYFPAWLHDSQGDPVEVPRAVALYERDGGVLWRHGGNARRARQLVLTSFARVDEYDYGFNWIFHEDGSLAMEVLLTGRMNVKLVEREEDEEEHGERAVFGHLVEPHWEAPNHQHFFSFRLDFDVDDAGSNSVMEMNTEAVPQGPDNPLGNAFAMRATPLRRERDARRRVKLSSDRKWMIVNTCAVNALGQPTGYAVVPGENCVPHAAAKSFARRHAGFINRHLWVTPYRQEEQYAAGDYVNDGPPGQGLPKWTRANRAIEDTDVVVWYTLGVTHVPRPEDWPLMPAHRAGFKLVPAGFFARNPAMKEANGK